MTILKVCPRTGCSGSLRRDEYDGDIYCTLCSRVVERNTNTKTLMPRGTITSTLVPTI